MNRKISRACKDDCCDVCVLQGCACDCHDIELEYEQEPDYGGAFDGFTVTSDAEGGL
jgi:hypothetical protein